MSQIRVAALVHGRDVELAVCVCGYARRFGLIDEVRRRLTRRE